MSSISTRIKWDSISNGMIQWAAFLYSTMIKWNNISNWMIQCHNIFNWMIRWDNISNWMIRWDRFLLDDSKRQHFQYWMMKWSRDTAESVLSRGTKRRREIEDDLRKERQLFSIMLELLAVCTTVNCLLQGCGSVSGSGSELNPDSIGSVDPDPYSGSGSRMAKITHKSRKKIKKFHVLKCWMFSFESWRLLL